MRMIVECRDRIRYAKECILIRMLSIEPFIQIRTKVRFKVNLVRTDLLLLELPGVKRLVLSLGEEMLAIDLANENFETVETVNAVLSYHITLFVKVTQDHLGDVLLLEFIHIYHGAIPDNGKCPLRKGVPPVFRYQLAESQSQGGVCENSCGGNPS